MPVEAAAAGYGPRPQRLARVRDLGMAVRHPFHRPEPSTSTLLDPSVAEPWFGLAQVMTSLERFDEAAWALSEAKLRFAPREHRWAQLHTDLGSALLAIGGCDDAVAEYWRALDTEPTFAQARRGRSLVGACEPASRQPEWPDIGAAVSQEPSP